MIKLPALPAKLYFATFLIIALGVYSFFNIQLYFDAESFREKTQKKTELLAADEMKRWVQITLEDEHQHLADLTAWDEIYQQFDDSSYYFFWHENRLKESEYWQPYFKDLELYTPDKIRLIAPLRKQAEDPDKLSLPIKLTHEEYPNSFFIIRNNQLDHVTITPIYSRENEKQVIGYLGLALDFLPHFYKSAQLTYVNKTSLSVKPSKRTLIIPEKDIIRYLNYSPTESQMDSFLWELIQDFITDVISVGLLVALVFFSFFRLSTLRPLNRLSDYLLDLKNHPNTLIEPPKSEFMFNEFETLKSTLFQYHQQLFNAKSEIEKQNQIASKQARIDALSGVYNRRAFDERMVYLLQTFHKHPTNIAFILFDCDFFKAINDTYGHEAGDEVIRVSAQTFSNSLPKDCPIYRIGGDEFASIVIGHNLNDAEILAQNCHESISSYDFKHLGIQESVSYSVGLSFVNEFNGNELTLIHKQADIALYSAKNSLTQKVQIYEPQMRQQSESLVSSKKINAIIKAINTGEGIQLHYQTIFHEDPSQGYAEILMRIKTKNDLILPFQIFQVIEHRGLEVELDKQIIRQVLELMHRNEIPQTGISINLSAHTLLREDLNALIEPMVPYLKKYKIVLEVLEGTLIRNLDLVAAKLNEVREQGFLVALDDFGSGYSSIRYLAQMPVDIVKFDLSLTQGLTEDDKTVNIIKHTAQMILDAEYDLVMEGVETKELADKAVEAGATHLQGYFFDKPTPFIPE